MTRESSPEPTREDLIALVSAQSVQILALVAENAALKARIAELERRLGLNSSNSGKPPSSDGLKKPARVRSLREKSKRKPGGQKGHVGETLRQSAAPDNIENHFPPACAECGAALRKEMAQGHAARQVFDLPEPKPLIVTDIARTLVAVPPAGPRRARRSRKASTRPSNMAPGSPPS